MVISPVSWYELREERYKTKGADEADNVTLRGPAMPLVSWFPTGLFDSRRLYRLRTGVKFFFPSGKATSPAAVPIRPFRQEIAVSTSLTISKSIAAVVHFPRPCFDCGGKFPFEIGGIVFCWEPTGIWRQKQWLVGERRFENARSIIPWSWWIIHQINN